MMRSVLLCAAIFSAWLATRGHADEPPRTEPTQSDSKPSDSKPSDSKPSSSKPNSPAVVAAEKPAEKPAEKGTSTVMATVEEVARRARPAIVVVTMIGREGQQQGLGTGFVVRADGLIATNYHVVGEARPVSVTTADGRKHEVVEVFASDRHQDLAIIRIKQPEKDLAVLPLGDSAQIPDGAPVVVLGNPHGLKHSVVNGSVVSGTREVDGRKMLQLAVPIEPGNSGGPVLDMDGRVLGIVTMKSLVTRNLGFAVEIDTLKPLLENPNPIAMSKWLTIGTIDPRDWTPLFGARWQQRGGRIFVTGTGQGFGGRSLCLSKTPTPDLPFEVAVTVKLDQESGAAGLVFHADGRDRHYGFYPSGGKLRLSRFEGSDVFSWQVLAERPVPAYRPGEWNRLKVRVEKDKIRCFVNDELAIESTDDAFTKGQVGLAKFRETEAEFRKFELASEVRDGRLAPEVARRLNELIDGLPSLATLQPKSLEPFGETPAESLTLIRQRADSLERRAAELRRIADDCYVQVVVAELAKLTKAEDDEIDLLRAALQIARLDDEDVDVEACVRQVDRMAAEIRDGLPADADDAARIRALNRHLFEENGFHGSRTDYYHKANSYLNRVLEDREGIPITLCLLYLEVGRRLNLKLEGVGLPGHFVVRPVTSDGNGALIDVFEEGKTLTREQAAAKVKTIADVELRDDHLHAATRREMLRRIARNLLNIAQEAQEREAMLRYLEALAVLDPDNVQERGLRAIVKFETGRRDAAVGDLDWFFEHQPEGLDLDRIRQMQEYFRNNSPPPRRAPNTKSE